MKAIVLQVSVLVLLSLALGLVTKAVHPRAPAWSIHSEPLLEGETTLSRIDELYGGDVLWIDARRADEYAKNHIPGALLINPIDHENQLFENFEAIQVETRPVVVYCQSRSCKASKTVAEFLRDNTILDPVLVLKGGWPAWVEANNPE